MAGDLALNCKACSYPEALQMPQSAINDLLKSKSFHRFTKAREAEAKMSVALIERMDAVSVNIGKLGEGLFKALAAALSTRGRK